MIRLLNESDYPRVCEIWESAVRATHDFLSEEDFLHYKEVLPSYFPHVRLAGWEEDGQLLGFIGPRPTTSKRSSFTTTPAARGSARPSSFTRSTTFTSTRST